MHCPNCGTKASDNQKFCRFCGLSLPRFSQLLTEELVNLDSGLLEKQRKTLRWRQLFIAGCFLTLILAKIVLDGPQPLGISMLAGLVLLMFVLTDPLGLYSALRAKLPNRGLPKHTAPVDSESVGRLSPESRDEAVSSVTEGTMELLEASEQKQSERSS